MTNRYDWTDGPEITNPDGSKICFICKKNAFRNVRYQPLSKRYECIYCATDRSIF